MSIKNITWLICTVILACSCTQYIPVGTIFEPSVHTIKKWTFILYMAADNDLESAAIQDLNELEAAQTDTSEINILVLLDRHPAYDSTNGNWTDTRLYEIIPDKAGPNNVIVSKRLVCPPLGLTTTGETELDMANPIVLEYLVDFALASYPAENSALIFWGHGTGWRGSPSYNSISTNTSRALAIDDTSSAFMGIGEANRAISGRGLSIIGFDTCFGALLEITYEFKVSADWLAGSEGIIPASGWDYTELFTRFMASDFSPESFGTALVGHFADQYELTPGASVSFIDLSVVDRLYTDFELFSRVVADSIVSQTELDLTRNLLLDEGKLLHALSYPCDAFIDIGSLSTTIFDNPEKITASTGRQALISEAAEKLQESVYAAVRSSWSTDTGIAKTLAVHLVPLTASNVPLTPHSSAYTKGSGDPGQSAFVRASTSWVPTASHEGTFLDKIFYTFF